jgi:FkbM family methyltransferase
VSADFVPLVIPGLGRSLQMAVHGPQDRHVSRQLREEGVWEPFETALVLASLAPGDVFVDVGANIGYFSLVAASVVGEQGAVYAFEPAPDNWALLRQSAARNGLAALIHGEAAALAERSGTASLYLSEDNLGDHWLAAAAGGPASESGEGLGRHRSGRRGREGRARPSLQVPLLRGDEYLRGRAAQIDFVKVDVQGAEYAALAGLMPLLRVQRSSLRLLVELTPLALRESGSSGRALIALLAELHRPFWIVDHVEHRLVASSAAELADWCDAVDAVPGDAGFMNIWVGSAPPGL